MKLQHIVIATVFLALSLSAAAQASIQFGLSDYSVTAQSSDPGLVIQTAKLLNTPGTTYEFTLDGINDFHVVDLFDIWTEETTVNPAEDTVAKPISVAFSFIAPPPSFGGSNTGETEGVRGIFFFLGFIPVPYGEALVEWDGPVVFNFGPNNDGALQVSLTDVSFNSGLGYGTLTPGREHGATVAAKFKLLAEPTPGLGGSVPGNAPEPGSIAVWAIISALGLFAVRRPH